MTSTAPSTPERPRPTNAIAARSVTAPLQTAPAGVAATSPTTSDPTSVQGIETLFVHPSCTIVKFVTSMGSSGFSSGSGKRGLRWTSTTERTVAAGSLEVYRVTGSVTFLRSGDLLHAIMPRSQCWCVDGVSKFALRVLPDTYYRIELPGTTEEDLLAVEDFKTVLGKVMHYERTACPFARDTTEDEELPELEDSRLKTFSKSDKARQWKLDRSFSGQSDTGGRLVSLRPTGRLSSGRSSTPSSTTPSQPRDLPIQQPSVDCRSVEADTTDLPPPPSQSPPNIVGAAPNTEIDAEMIPDYEQAAAEQDAVEQDGDEQDEAEQGETEQHIQQDDAEQDQTEREQAQQDQTGQDQIEQGQTERDQIEIYSQTFTAPIDIADGISATSSVTLSDIDSQKLAASVDMADDDTTTSNVIPPQAEDDTTTSSVIPSQEASDDDTDTTVIWNQDATNDDVLPDTEKGADTQIIPRDEPGPNLNLSHFHSLQQIPTDMPPSPPDSSAGLPLPEDSFDGGPSSKPQTDLPQPGRESTSSPSVTVDQPAAPDQQITGRSQGSTLSDPALEDSTPFSESSSRSSSGSAKDDPFAAIQARILARRSIGGTTTFYPSVTRENTSTSTTSVSSSISSRSRPSPISNQRNLTSALVQKACAVFLGPPAYLVAIMLKIAARFSNGKLSTMVGLEGSDVRPGGVPGSFHVRAASQVSEDEDDFGVALHSPIRKAAANDLRDRRGRGNWDMD